MGLFSSKSSSSSTNETNNISTALDNRQVLTDSIGATGSSAVSVNNTSTSIALDPGALRTMELALLANTDTSKAAISSADRSAATAAAAAASSNAQLTKGMKDVIGFAQKADATNKEGFSSLLNAGLSLFDRQLSSMDKLAQSNEKTTLATQDAVRDAYQTATAEKSGSLDNKTITIIAIAAAAALAFIVKR